LWAVRLHDKGLEGYLVFFWGGGGWAGSVAGYVVGGKANFRDPLTLFPKMPLPKYPIQGQRNPW
jgi:hypothetical protein